MPSPATPHCVPNRGGNTKSNAPSKQKLSDVGRPLGVHNTNTVRDRVLKWQEQGGGVVSANEPGYQDDDENIPAESKPKSAKEKRESVPVPRSGTRKRSHSTPRKRVISDEHWKLNRSATKANTPPPNRPAPRRIGEYTTNDEFANPRASKKDHRSNENLKPSPHSGDRNKERVSRERRKQKQARGAIEEEDGTQDDESSLFTRSALVTKSIAEESEWTDLGKGKAPPSLDDADWAVSEADFSELSRRRAQGAVNKPRGLQKPPKGGIFTHMLDESRRMFARPEPDSPKPIHPIPNRGAKIESWLSDTPDPFIDGEEHDVEVPAPLNTRSNRPKRHHRREEGQDRVPEPDPSPEGERKRRSRRRTREHSSERERDKWATEKKTLKERELFIVSPPRSKSRERQQSQPHDRSDDGIRVEPLQKVDEPDNETHPLSDGSDVPGDNPPVPLNRKRPFPSTGAQLSTIPSIETLSTRDPAQSQASTDIESENRDSRKSPNVFNPEERDHFDPNSLPAFASQLRRRLTTHDDLISVLSAPNNRSRSIRSARSIRTNRSRLTDATIPDLLKELSADETKYMRELKTLVGGVIPVLLTCVLSKSDSAVAAGLFRPSTDPKDEVNFSKPIVDMGVAVERLKAMHKRIPQDNADSLLQWAQGAQRVYRQYLRCWRLGFKDVVVNLAPLEEGEAGNDGETKSLDEGLERDESGDVVDSDGEKVDVAYLLKRPLVRLKYLAKTFKGINILQPSPRAGEIAEAYQGLVTDARRRARDERARLEDESAARVDPSRSRDPMTLGVLAGITVDQTRHVRARDFFALSLYHSSGQLIDCRAELLLRDSPPGKGAGGDLLICEIDHSDRWLLFPPIDVGCVSARNGDRKGEIVVMLRSHPKEGESWQELLSLQIDEEDIGFEWVQLLGLDPVPPAISRSQSFINRARQRQRNQTASNEDAARLEAPSNPRDVDVPIGEKAARRAARRSQTSKDQSSNPSTVDSSSAAESQDSTAITRESDYTPEKADSATKRRPQSQILHSRTPGGDDKSPNSLRRSPAKRVSRYGEGSSPAPTPPKPAAPDTSSMSPSTPNRYYEANQQQIDQSPGSIRDTNRAREPQPPKTPIHSEPSPRLSSVPSAELPIIPKIRTGSSESYIPQSLEPASDEEEYMPIDAQIDDLESPLKGKGHSRSGSDASETDDDEPPPPPPPHRTPSPSNTPVLSPSGVKLRRRGSSPLKHQYEPSTTSDSYSDSDTSTVRHYDMDSGSETSATETSDDETDEEFLPVDAHDLPKPGRREPTHASSATSSLSPSNSASQGGYRSVPAQPSKSTKTIASVFAWSDRGSWDNLFPDECTVIVSPGLIEAYEMSVIDADSNSTSPKGSSKSKRPLVGLELTPLVPIRRGTAIDISIRSPPSKRSRITSSNNIMFRSRNPEECEVLYGLINQSRLNNPTYIALQNARGPFADQPPALEDSDKTSRWFGWPRRRRSYRASGAPQSLADNSESSVGTMSSAFSALKRFGAGSKMFSIARSTVTSRSGQKDGSLHSGSADSGSFFPSSGIGRIAAAIKGSDGIGLSNAKIRLYTRETQTKWRDMGAARLTIMPAPDKRPDTSGSGRSGRSTSTGHHDTSPPGSGSASPARGGADSEKRILIRGKTRGEVLLDVCLGESSFERIARTGIAVSVWEENEGGAVAKVGGVGRGSFKIYMIQMKSEAEAAYTFGLVGKLRY